MFRQSKQPKVCGHMGDMYLKSLLVHTTSELPLSDKVRFTEDGVEKKPGEGLWQTVTIIRSSPQLFVDVRQGVAAVFAVVEESGVPALLVARLKTVNGKIAEIETMVTRGQKEGMIFDVDAIKPATLGLAMNRVPYKTELNSREDVIRIAQHYPEGLKTGSFTTVDVPFAPKRIASRTVALWPAPGASFASGCDHIKTQRIPTLSGITYRVALVDEELGVVLLRQDFGPGSVSPGNSLIAWEAFKVYGRQIHAVEAFMKVTPTGSKSGWD